MPTKNLRVKFKNCPRKKGDMAHLIKMSRSEMAERQFDALLV
jgi:hypothetical protein